MSPETPFPKLIAGVGHAISSQPMLGWTRADLVVLTAIELEYQAVLRVEAGAVPGSRWHEAEHRRLPIALREFVARDGRLLRVVVTRAPDMGKSPALTTLLPLVETFGPSCIAMCGVCAGRPGKTALGDVIAAERLFDHDAGKEKPGRFEADLRTYSLPGPWKIALERFKPAARFGGEAWWRDRPTPVEWQERWVLWQLRAGVADPRSLSDSSARCPQWPEVIDQLWQRGDLARGSFTLTEQGRQRASEDAARFREFPDLSPASGTLPFRLHVAPIGTGSAVIEDEAVWGFVSEHMRKTLGIEMEASALAEMVRARELVEPVKAVVMKGVMDFANLGRDDHFKEYAARAAAECLLAFLRDQLPVAPHTDDAAGAAVPPPQRAGAPPDDARRLHGRLSKLTDPLFEKIVFLSAVDRTLMPAKASPLSDRVLSLAERAAHDPALVRRLAVLLDEHAPWTR